MKLHADSKLEPKSYQMNFQPSSKTRCPIWQLLPAFSSQLRNDTGQLLHTNQPQILSTTCPHSRVLFSHTFVLFCPHYRRLLLFRPCKFRAGLLGLLEPGKGGGCRLSYVVLLFLEPKKSAFLLPEIGNRNTRITGALLPDRRFPSDSSRGLCRAGCHEP